MKQIIVLSIAIVVALSFSSCKKSYQCECTTTVNGQTSTDWNLTDKLSKKEAKKQCEGFPESENMPSTTCKIKNW